MTKATSFDVKHCRFCSNTMTRPFLDLGKMALANSNLRSQDLEKSEPAFPLRCFLCEKCLLVQLADYADASNIFHDHYAYFSSFSKSWLAHAKKYVDYSADRFKLDPKSFVVEVASNDGYLLQYFKEKGIPVLGIEPSGNCAQEAVKKGISSVVEFFGVKLATRLAAEGKKADLIIGNNVLAHVPDLNDFVEGLKILVKPEGRITMEFPHLLRLIEQNQFDTIYHEHFSYFSLTAVEKVFAAHGLTLFDVEELPTHGGSIRIFAAPTAGKPAVTPAVARLKEIEKNAGLLDPKTYDAYALKVENVKSQLLQFLQDAKKKGKKVVAYGAPAKGNTLLNFCGVGGGLISYTVDLSPHKQGLFLPGSHLPIFSPEKIVETRPDYILILPWNIKDEIVQQMAPILDWGAQFVTAIPYLQIFGL